MRLALVCPYSLSQPGGVQGQVLGLARAYAAHGHEVSVFAPLDGDTVRAPSGVHLVDSGHSVRVPANGSVAPVSLSPVAAGRAVGELRAGRPDVIHVHEPFAPGLPLGLLVARGFAPEVATFHRSGASLFYRAFGPAVRHQSHRLAVCCAVSAAASATAATAVDGPIEVLFNGVDCDRYADAEPWPGDDRPVVVFLGRHEERKGLAVLLEAFDRLRGSNLAVDPVLWVVGDGPQRHHLERRWPADADIRWLGTIPDDEKVRRLATADVLCAPSLGRESFGIVLLEAMAARAVVVASDITGYQDAAGGCAVFVPPGRPDELARALSGTLEGRLALAPTTNSDGDAFRPFADDDGVREGRTRWLDEAEDRARTFSMDRLAGRYEAIFARVLQGFAP
jgi:phosphatidyl-myo-inositol alpha-mannosyltransferase